MGPRGQCSQAVKGGVGDRGRVRTSSLRALDVWQQVEAQELLEGTIGQLGYIVSEQGTHMNSGICEEKREWNFSILEQQNKWD